MPFDQSVEGALSRIGNVREDRLFNVMIHSSQDRFSQCLAEFLALAVDLFVSAA